MWKFIDTGASRRQGVLLLAGMTAAGACLAMEPAEIFEKRSPAVWIVNVLDAQGQRLRQDSAVVIAREQLATPCHVLARGKSLSVTREHMTLDARLVHADVERDLCIIEAKGVPGPRAPA